MRPPEPPSSLSPPPRSEMPSFPGAALSSPISPYHESPFSPISEDDAGVIDDDDFSDKMTTYMNMIYNALGIYVCILVQIVTPTQSSDFNL